MSHTALPRRPVLLAGATGLTGRELLRQLSLRQDVEIYALVRRMEGLAGDMSHVHEVLFDFDHSSDYERLGTEIPCRYCFCALGTTLAQAGSPEAFRKVDLEYPKRLLQRLKALEPPPVAAFISSIGAHRPKGLYLQTKAELERAVLESGLPSVLARPSLLLGDRREDRPRERWAAFLVAKPYRAVISALAPWSPFFWRYAPIEVEKLARALIRASLEDEARPGRILEGLQLHHPILLDPTHPL